MPRKHHNETVSTFARIREVCARNHGSAAARDLHALGLSQQAVRRLCDRDLLVEVLPLVYTLDTRLSRDGLLAAALLSVDGWAALTGWGAVRAYGIRDAPPSEPTAVLTTTRKGTIPDAVMVHRTRRRPLVRVIRGLAVVEPGRMLVDLGLTASVEEVHDVVNGALDARLLTERQIFALARRYAGHNGLGVLRHATAELDRQHRSESTLERRVLTLLRTLPVPPFQTQHWLTGLSGRRYRADIAWPELRLALEPDGRSVHERQQAMEDDRARDNDLQGVGWTTSRVMWRHLTRWDEREEFVRSLLATIERRRSDP